MTGIRSYNDLITRVGSNYTLHQPIYAKEDAAGGAWIGVFGVIRKLGDTKLLPNPLPTGVTAYIPTRVSVWQADATVANMCLICKMIDMGNLTLATPTFTDGSAYPTVTELGTSNATFGPVLIEITTALNATPGAFTVTYVDQDGHTAETTTSQNLTASAALGQSGYLTLNAGDVGVRDITTATRTAGTTPTGTVQFWGIIPICLMNVGGTSQIVAIDNLITGPFNPVKLGAGDKIGVFWAGNSMPSATAMGDIYFVGDS